MLTEQGPRFVVLALARSLSLSPLCEPRGCVFPLLAVLFAFSFSKDVFATMTEKCAALCVFEDAKRVCNQALSCCFGCVSDTQAPDGYCQYVWLVSGTGLCFKRVVLNCRVLSPTLVWRSACRLVVSAQQPPPP